MAAPFKIRRSQQLVGFALGALMALLTLARGQGEPEEVPDTLSLLERAARQYSDLKSYRITRQEFFASEQPSNPSPSMMTAVEAPGDRYRFEGDSGIGKAVQVCDGHWVWYYRPTENAYTRRPATGKKPDLPEVLFPGDGEIKGAAGLHDMTWLAGVFKSAQELSEARLILKGKPVECYVVQVSNDDRKIPLPNPFTYRIWIEKGSLKIRKIAEYYTATFNRSGVAPISFPATRISVYPEVVLNEPIADAEFQFTPPESARQVIDFADRAQLRLPPKTTGRKPPHVVLTALDGSKVRLESLRGHPVLIDLWATWCAPCVEAFPDLARLYQQTRSIGLVILSIDISDDAIVAQSYMEKMHYPWQNFHANRETDKAFGPSAVPRTIIINSDGESVFDKVSPTMDELRAVIDTLGSESGKSAGS